MRGVAGKVAIVTGSTAGIGLAIAERLVEEGAHVVVSSRKEAAVKAAVAQLEKKAKSNKVLGIVCHVGEAADRARLLKETVDAFGRIDILVNNVAVNPTFGATMETSEAAINKIFGINVVAPFLLTRDALPHMAPGSSVLIVTSLGAYAPNTLLGFYSISKTALLALTRVMAEELAHKGIRVNGIAPGVIKTKFSSVLWESEEAAQQSKERSWLNRIGEPEDCAGMAVFLCSSDCGHITGETVLITGGAQARL